MEKVNRRTHLLMSPVYAFLFFSALSFSVRALSYEVEEGRSVIKDERTDTFFSAQLELDRLNGLIAKDNDNADLYYNRGWIYEQMNDPVNAEKDYTTAIEINNEHSDAFYNRGVIYLKDGRYGLAINDFSQVIRITPESADAFCNRGNAYLAVENNKNALQDFDSAIQLAPQDPDLYYNRALAYLAMGKKKRAVKDMKEASRLGHLQAREYLIRSGDIL